jgi:hypothetical protein
MDAAFSMQHKLDQIAKDRGVLELQRDLLRLGLREGDRVIDQRGQQAGTVAIDRRVWPPRLLVKVDGGSVAPWSAEHWKARQRY